MELNKLKIISIVGVILILIFTYFRENLLLEINALLSGELFDRSYFYWFFDFFKDMDQPNLVRWKWGVTAFFSLMITLLTIGSLYCWFGAFQMIKFISKLYLLLFGVLTIVAVVGFIFNSFATVYPLLRKVLGLVQSPIPFFGFYLLIYKINNQKEPNSKVD